MIFLVFFYRITRSHDPGHEIQILARFDFSPFYIFFKLIFFNFIHSMELSRSHIMNR
jgi:hypothetical protein